MGLESRRPEIFLRANGAVYEQVLPSVGDAELLRALVEVFFEEAGKVVDAA